MTISTTVSPCSPPAVPETRSQDIERIFDAQQAYRWKMAFTNAGERIQRLKKLHDHILRNREQIQKALHDDFRKPASEVDITEIYVVLSEIRHTIRHLKRWMKPQRVKPTLAMVTTRSRLHYEPRGVVLIISPWNYPFNLSLGPLVSALAAGNCAIIKPSEYTPQTSALIKRLLGEIFEEKEVAVVEGAVETSQALLALPFDHIFFTGSPAIGKKIMAAAAQHLTSVTLELGGKSPVIVTESADVQDAAEKIVAGKFANCSQTCIAPDYVLVAERVLPTLVSALKASISAAYGDSEDARRASKDFARIVNSRHFQRLTALLDDAVKKGAHIEIGGDHAADERYFAPTVLTDVSENSRLMEEEIFGPILPIIPMISLDLAINSIWSRPKPLALYIFSKKQAEIDHILRQTSAGSSCVNEVAIQFLHLGIPFGGVNNSGIGNSHGFYGFRAFSHERPVLKHHRSSPLKLLYPPFTGFTKKLINLVVKYL